MGAGVASTVAGVLSAVGVEMVSPLFFQAASSTVRESSAAITSRTRFIPLLLFRFSCCSKYTNIVVVSRAFVKVGAEILQIQIFASPTGESFLIFASEASTPPYCCRACRCIRRAGSRQGPQRRGPRQEPGLRFQTRPRRTRRPWAGRGPRS